MLDSRGLSQVIVILITVGIVVALSVLVAYSVMGAVSLFRESPSLSVVGGHSFIDPSNGKTIVGEVLVASVGKGSIRITKVEAIYGGSRYTAVCLNCNTTISDSYPQSANDVFYIRVYFTPSTYPKPGDRVTFIVEYAASGSIKRAAGRVVISQ